MDFMATGGICTTQNHLVSCCIISPEPFSADLPPPRLAQQNGFDDNIPAPAPRSSPSQLTTEELSKNIAPVFEEWYHGALSRKQVLKGEIRILGVGAGTVVGIACCKILCGI